MIRRKDQCSPARYGIGILAALSMLVLIVILPSSSFAQQVEFNYNGLVRVQGEPFDGAGRFKFSIVSRNGDETYWANDGVTFDGGEPTAFIAIDVSEGFFSINIGDGETTGMAPLDASLFNGEEKVHLRVWFSDGIRGFEKLNPDRRVVNPALLGIQGLREGHIYVNPVSGDDRNSGLTAGKSKKTIQAAWNALPSLIRVDMTIHLADGIYRETTTLNGKSTIGTSAILIVGDPNSTSDVRVTGAETANETLPVLDYGFIVENQKNVHFKGISFDYFAEAPIHSTKGAQYLAEQCAFSHSRMGLFAESSSQLEVKDCTFHDGYTNPSWAILLYNSKCVLTDSTIGDWTHGGHASRLSLFERISGTSVSGCDEGFHIVAGSYAIFETPPSSISNCPTGVRGALNGIVSLSQTNVTYGNVTTPLSLDTGAVNYQ
jgi:hypothetical protein